MTDQTPDENSQEVDAGLRVRIRMYRQGLGGCFLLSFFKGEIVKHVLIDCGVLQGTRDGEETMQKVARNIRRTTGGKLDLVVGTHEHWDHLSGFVQAQQIFNQIKFRQIWLAWTEDPNDTLAQELGRERDMALQAVKTALDLMPEEMAQQRRELFGLLNFYAEPLSGVSISGAREALDYLLGREDALVCFCRPDEPPRALEGLPEVRFFVLGPPRDEKMLKKTRPTKRGKEGYGLAPETSLLSSFLAAVSGRADGKTVAETDGLPFDERYGRTKEQALEIPFFNTYYGFSDESDQGPAWRRVGFDWLASAGSLALNLDSATNNTSLALAIELGNSGQVLLFPADAQVGNWLSWDELKWKLAAPDGQTQLVKAQDLLQRTVFYKLGHHGSHNATLREKGLERMTSPDLQAMIPVDRAMVETRGWNMPFPSLLERLQEKTRGRVIRLDDGIPNALPQADDGAPLINQAAWRSFLGQTESKALYLDLFIETGLPG